MINFKRAKHWTAHTTPESVENITDSCFTLIQIRLCQHVCMTQWNTGIFREIYIKLYRVALQGIWNKKFHITSWIQLVLSCSLGLSTFVSEPRHEKTCIRDFRPGKTQTCLFSYRDQLESCYFGFRKYRYYTTVEATNKGADQSARMRRLICTYVVRIWLKQLFPWRGSSISLRLQWFC